MEDPKDKRSKSSKDKVQDSKDRDRNQRRSSSRKKSRSSPVPPLRSSSTGHRSKDSNLKDKTRNSSDSFSKPSRDSRTSVVKRCDNGDARLFRKRQETPGSRSNGPREGRLSHRSIKDGARDTKKDRRSKSPSKSLRDSKSRDERRSSSRKKSRSPLPRQSRHRSKDKSVQNSGSSSKPNLDKNRASSTRRETDEPRFSIKRHNSLDTRRSQRSEPSRNSIRSEYTRKRHESRDPCPSKDERLHPSKAAPSLASKIGPKREHSLPDHNYASKRSKIDGAVKVLSPDPKSLSSGSSSDDDLEEPQVEKWVRSAPAELYYRRENNGQFIATDRAKLLCEKFEKKLLIRAQVARLEAERLGEEKLIELTQKENLEIVEQRQQRRIRKTKQKDGNKNVETESKVMQKDSCHSKIIEIESKVKPKSCIEVDLCKHEEGEICDCHEIKSDEKKCSGKKGSCDTKLNHEKHSHKCHNDRKFNGITELESKQHGDKEKNKKTRPDNSKKENGKKSGSKKPCKKSSSSSSDSGSNSASESSEEDYGISRCDAANRELEKKKKHPRRMHLELWHNDPGLMNDGPVCRCSAKARRFGIRHGFYPGESPIPFCNPLSTNSDRLVHYRITISPPKNFLVKTPSVIPHDGHEYIFEGFSLFSHYKVDLNLPPCKVIRFNIRYDVFIAEEKFPESFCVKELEVFETYVFREILELLDLKYDWNEDGSCAPFHLMPRFVRQLPDNGKEILSMNRVLLHLLKSDREVMKEEELPKHYTVEQSEWQNFADKHKGMIVTRFGQKPSAVRVDQIDRDVSGQEADPQDGIPFPLIVHFGIRPPQLSYAGNASYQRAWRRYVKYRHLLSNMAKPTVEEKRKLVKKEMKLQEMRTASSMKRDVTVAISCKGFRTTGIFCDLVQHAMLIPVLVAHLRFHKALSTLESTMAYEFKNRYLLQLAMTHPSYRENFGTNPDHARNALTNCGIRQPEYGDRRIHYASTRKRGINTLINIMAKFGSDHEMESEITHNERLEFLGDAVVEFVTSIHLFHLFPDLEEGGLATYRAAIVQNQHLAVLANTLNLDQYMLYAHGSDLCHDSELRHAMANCFEALMGALFLDGGIEEVADRVFGKTLYGKEPILHDLWTNYSRHPLQTQEPNGDRHWIKSHTVLQNLSRFEESIGVEFTHIRLLARAFTDRSLGYNNLSRGSNQRLEFLGDTVLQLISSEYLYRHFPDHHEGHLSLLRSSLVNNRTQALVCDDLGMTQYAMRGDPKSEMKTKDRADLLEAFLGALYIDKGLVHCTVFCSVCFFPRLNKSIIKQEWNDPKSKLQQCCLTLRAMDGREPDIPVYKVTQSLGPTNTRIYIVAVYFRSRRLATAKGHSIQEAEMNAAAVALKESGHLFPQLHHQRSVMDKTSKKLRYRPVMSK